MRSPSISSKRWPSKISLASIFSNSMRANVLRDSKPIPFSGGKTAADIQLLFTAFQKVTIAANETGGVRHESDKLDEVPAKRKYLRVSVHKNRGAPAVFGVPQVG